MFIFHSGFYKAGNFVAAINAFTAAIVLDDTIPSYPLIPVSVVRAYNLGIPVEKQIRNPLEHFLEEVYAF